MKQKNLEDTIKEKITPMLEETLEKSIGVVIPKLESDITDQLRKPQLDIYIPADMSFKQAKKKFKREFIRRELKLHLGNVSQLAKTLDIDRRSIHRAIKELDIDIELLRSKHDSRTRYQQELIDKTIRHALDYYKGIIHPEKMEKVYQEVHSLSRNIVKFLPHQDLTWKEAEQEFERQFLARAVEEAGSNIAAAAKRLGLRAETLHRKVKKLRLNH